MGRIVYAEECLLNYLEKLKNPNDYTIGLILGQSTEQKDYVVHLARTPPPASKDVIEESNEQHQQNSPAVKRIKTLGDVPSSWVADHAKHVTRMLPVDCLNENNSMQKLKSITSAIHKNLSVNPYLYGNNPNESIILAFNNSNKKFSCKSFGDNASMKNADWKFQLNITKWYQLETRVDFDQLFPIENNKKIESLKKQHENILDDIYKKINSAIIAIEDSPKSPDELVQLTGNKKKKFLKQTKNDESNLNDVSLQAAIYIPCSSNSQYEIKQINCNGQIRLIGQLVSRTFVHELSRVEEATNAIKQDIMRSLASRLEMHWDSLLEEENSLPEDNVTLHEPPRRVLVALPHSKITLSDYLFPGEGHQEALISLQELLDLKVEESSVQKEFELQVDPSEFYCQNELSSKPSEHAKYQDNSMYIVYGTGLGIAISLLILAIIIQYFY
ncbi:hypothetical protein HCN44_008915 [Aphidius gifuensis]|uniref:Uncharacterized protein n=1 Tax=Aphidius gifuensis TaxID=684658 RepID=A0A835CP69_APHGI|nr:hypothetical protein HCN44_008915 [Aphidius gifuensis]